MKLVMFDDFIPGALRDETVIDLRPALGHLADLPWDERMPALVANYDALRAGLNVQVRDGQSIPLSSVRLRSPNPRPPKFLCGIGNYAQPGEEPPGFLDFFFKSPESVIGPGDTVELPNVEASQYQGEASLGVVIAREGRNIAEFAGLSYVFGYTAFIDVFGKDVGRPVGTYWAKSFDTFGPMGPCIVTADELDPQALQVTLSVNGQSRQSYSTADMLYRIPAQVAAATGIITLQPGDMLGCGSDPRNAVMLSDGDQLVLEVTEIGKLGVNVRDPQKRTWPRDVARARPSR